MLRKNVIKLLSLYFAYSSFWMALPYDWSFKTSCLRLSRYKLRRLLYYNLVVIDWMIVGYLGSSIYFSVKNGSLPTSYLILHSFYFACDLIAASFKLTTVLSLEQIPEFVNQMIKVDKDFEAKLDLETPDREEDAQRDSLFRYMITFIMVWHVHIALSYFLFLDKYDPIHYLTYAWVESPDDPWWYMLPFMLMGGWLYNEVWINHLLYMFPALLYMVSTNSRQTELRTLVAEHEDQEQTSKPKSKSRITLTFIAKVYRGDQILNRMFNNWVSNIAMPVNYFALLAIAIFCCVGGIRSFGVIGMPDYLQFPMIAAAVIGFMRIGYPTAAKLSESSATFRDSWFYQVRKTDFRQRAGSNETRQWVQAFGRSCRNLRLELSFCFNVEPDTFRNMLVIIVEKTIDLLLSF